MEGYQEVNEINLIDLMFYCLKRWRWIVVCMVLLAVVTGIYKYQATIKDNQLKKKEQVQQFETEQGGGSNENGAIVFEDPVSLATSFAVLGMVSGACLICLIFCIGYIVGGRLQSVDNFQEKFGMPLLGVIRKNETKKKWFSLIDRWISRLEEGPYVKISRREQIKIAAINVRTAIYSEFGAEIKRVMIAGTVASDDVTEICEQLVEEIEGITFSPYRQIVFHATALKKVEYYEGILFIEKKGESYEKLIRYEKKLALDRKVRVLGTIVC